MRIQDRRPGLRRVGVGIVRPDLEPLPAGLRPAPGRAGTATRLGDLLIAAGRLRPRALRLALAHQARDGGRLGEVLLTQGLCAGADVWAGLAHQWGVRLHDLDRHWVDPELCAALPPAAAITHRILPLRAVGGVAAVAMADPGDARARAVAEQALGRRVVAVLAAPGALRRRQEAAYRDALLAESTEGLRRRDPEASAARLLTHEQKVVLGGAGALALIALVLTGPAFFVGVSALVVGAYAVVVGFRGYITLRGGSVDADQVVSHAELAGLTDLPVYTILCPLYREPEVLPQLVRACRRLRYPKIRLDVKLLLEEDDLETRAVVSSFRLPGYFDVIIVPAVGQRTKPKACNYGLQFARGDYTVIFDAEDIPEPDQLLKAVAVFRRHGGEVGCVQAKLNYYNAGQNTLTGWFALEYTSWFDFFLPGLVSRGLPIPLGGSSNHFPTPLLRELGGWDPDNVTEDADLGMRLHRTGRHTLIMDSTTWEEANSDFVNWMKQRSRWGKGYFLSWLVQMRHPWRLLREVGLRSFLAIQLILGGTYAISLLNLATWTLTALWVLARFGFIAYLFPATIYYLGMLEMVFGNFLFIYLGLWAITRRGSYSLSRVALAVPVYWLMISLAMVKATLQLFTDPTFWEKTVHGLHQLPAVATLPVEEADSAAA